MASIQQRGRKHQVRMTVPGTGKVFKTFDTREEADAFVERVGQVTSLGYVPEDLMKRPVRQERVALARVVADYAALDSTTPSDRELLPVAARGLERVWVRDLTYKRVEAYVAQLKTQRLAPGSIRKRVGALARALDWHHRRETGKDQSNPFRLLPRGYSAYPAGPDNVVDVARDRVLSPDGLARVRAALAGERRPDRERPWGPDPLFALFFELVLGTGLRLSEAFRLRVDQVDLQRGFLRVEGSKGRRGAKKPRNVPLLPALRTALAERCAGRAGLVFPYWDGRASELKRASARLSSRFSTLFAYAQVEDFTEHDLRHCACCAWVKMRRPTGGWTFSEVEIAKIMGWSNLAMMLRYASLRGEDLADRLLE